MENKEDKPSEEKNDNKNDDFGEQMMKCVRNMMGLSKRPTLPNFPINKKARFNFIIYIWYINYLPPPALTLPPPPVTLPPIPLVPVPLPRVNVGDGAESLVPDNLKVWVAVIFPWSIL